MSEFKRKIFTVRDNTGLTDFGISHNKMMDICDRDEELERCYAHIKKLEALKQKADYIVSALLHGKIVCVTEYLETAKKFGCECRMHQALNQMGVGDE